MAISLSPEELTSVVRLKNFSVTVTASVVTEEPPESEAPPESGGGEEPLVTVVAVTAELVGDPDSGIVVTPGETSVTISGRHITGFVDKLTYVDDGQSDKTQTPKTAIGIQNMPQGQNLFNLDQDPKKSLERQFKIIVTLSDDSTETAVLTQTVENDLDSIKDFMGSYFK
jgi:hypothetical protein